MTVEARFMCEKKQVIDQTSVELVLRAAITGRDNTEWAPYTPSGTIHMVINGAAADQFVQDGRYQVLIRQVDAGE